MSASLSVADAPGLSGDVRRVVVECPHGTITLHLVGEPTAAQELAAVRLALLTHRAEELCACSATLSRRYVLAATRR